MKSGAVFLGGVLLLSAAWVLSANPREAPQFSERQRSYWAFQPVAAPEVPADSAGAPIDAFVRARLAEKQLDLSPPADKVTLIRRASFDLTGLPPTPEEVETFVRDDSPDAFAKLVDRLLDSPRYGERWARHWLDLARYAESEGFKSDETRPNAWRYRDYVIDAFNSDKPYDRFVQEQIAGDELWPESAEARVATGFNRHYADETNAAILMQRRSEILLDITDTVGATFMGLTYGCAKCHDHKFDPILQADYYRLQAFFANVTEDDEVVLLSEKEHGEHKRKLAAWQEATREIRAEMQALLAEKREETERDQIHRRAAETQAAYAKPPEQRTMYERLMLQKHQWALRYFTDEKLAASLKDEKKARYKELEQELAKFEAQRPGELPLGSGLAELGPEAPPTHILSLANFAAPQQEVQPGFLSILDAAPARYQPPANGKTSGRRTALAMWLTDPDNPLTGRVMANRLWHYHFGQGIVRTPSDFGLMGERPTHPELLDYLAKEFVGNGWSLKRMHRLIMNSETYKQASAHVEAAAQADPFNKLLWRFPPQRLEGEVIRDSMLAVAGKLNTQMGGPSIFPTLPAGAAEPRGGWDTSESAADQNRRSIYIFVRRNARYPMLESFDMPDTHEACARRNTTTSAPQALALLNSLHTVEWAKGFAGRVVERAGADAAKQVDEAYRLAYSRRPDAWEKDTALTFFDRQSQIIAERAAAGKTVSAPERLPSGMSREQGAALVDFCHALLNSNEFVYRN